MKITHAPMDGLTDEDIKLKDNIRDSRILDKKGKRYASTMRASERVI